MNIKDKTIFITGGSSGLGLSLVKSFLKKGAKVVTNGSTEKSLKSLNEIGSDNLTIYAWDVRDSKKTEEIINKHASIDILINNAGVWSEGNVGDLSTEKIQETIDVNLTSSIALTNKVISMIKEVKGFVINIVSTSGFTARAGQSVYVASKYGMRGFTDALRNEVSDDGVRVVGVYPGGMRTSFYDKKYSNVDTAKWMDTDDIAKTIIHLVENDKTLTIDNLVLNRKK